ncbi:MAG TPA: flagellar hook-basal body complex protein FliE [Candidatus Hydrogenedentes bacterium]|nr:flagellar hook-basal body complex protein FliE [Candidatus Hydrogenedentota bacterium]
MPEPTEIQGIGPGRPEFDPTRLRTAKIKVEPDGTSFKDVLADAIGEVQRLQNEADTTIKRLVAGEIKDVTQAMVAVEKADIAFQTMMTVRNKIVAAYEEIMRMQI